MKKAIIVIFFILEKSIYCNKKFCNEWYLFVYHAVVRWILPPALHSAQHCMALQYNVFVPPLLPFFLMPRSLALALRSEAIFEFFILSCPMFWVVAHSGFVLSYSADREPNKERKRKKKTITGIWAWDKKKLYYWQMLECQWANCKYLSI